MQLINHDLLLLYLSHPYIAPLLPYFVYFGIALVVYALVTSLAFALNRLIVSPIDWERVRKGVAVVSGATDGIGLEFVRELHARGVNVILLGRSSEKLQAAIESVRREASSATLEAHRIDFAAATKADWDAFQAKFIAAPSSEKGRSRPPVTVLINCAGTSHEHPKFFAEESPLQIQQIISVNCSSALQLTRAVLPAMLDNGFGIVWNVGSMSAEVVSPLLQTYAASKAFLKTWSVALAAEVRSGGVHVELLNTYYVATKMSKKRSTSWTCVSPAEYVRAVLAGLSGGPFRTPVFSHAVMYKLICAVPSFLLEQLTFKMMLGIRSAALRRAAKHK